MLEDSLLKDSVYPDWEESDVDDSEDSVKVDPDDSMESSDSEDSIAPSALNLIVIFPLSSGITPLMFVIGICSVSMSVKAVRTTFSSRFKSFRLRVKDLTGWSTLGSS